MSLLERLEYFRMQKALGSLTELFAHHRAVLGSPGGDGGDDRRFARMALMVMADCHAIRAQAVYAAVGEEVTATWEAARGFVQDLTEMEEQDEFERGPDRNVDPGGEYPPGERGSGLDEGGMVDVGDPRRECGCVAGVRYVDGPIRLHDIEHRHDRCGCRERDPGLPPETSSAILDWLDELGK